jgi:hypothetical protein
MFAVLAILGCAQNGPGQPGSDPGSDPGSELGADGESAAPLPINLKTDPHNCGTIGHDCNHETCIEGACTPSPWPFYCNCMSANTCSCGPQNADLYCVVPDHDPGASCQPGEVFLKDDFEVSHNGWEGNHHILPTPNGIVFPANGAGDHYSPRGLFCGSLELKDDVHMTVELGARAFTPEAGSTVPPNYAVYLNMRSGWYTQYIFLKEATDVRIVMQRCVFPGDTCFKQGTQRQTWFLPWTDAPQHVHLKTHLGTKGEIDYMLNHDGTVMQGCTTPACTARAPIQLITSPQQELFANYDIGVDSGSNVVVSHVTLSCGFYGH